MCSSKILLLEFLFAFMFFTAAHLSLVAASISHFLTAAMKFSCFSSNEIRLLCFYRGSSKVELLRYDIQVKKKKENFLVACLRPPLKRLNYALSRRSLTVTAKNCTKTCDALNYRVGVLII